MPYLSERWLWQAVENRVPRALQNGLLVFHSLSRDLIGLRGAISTREAVVDNQESFPVRNSLLVIHNRRPSSSLGCCCGWPSPSGP